MVHFDPFRPHLGMVVAADPGLEHLHYFLIERQHFQEGSAGRFLWEVPLIFYFLLNAGQDREHLFIFIGDEVATDGKKSRWGPLLQLDNSDSAKIRVFIHEDRVVFPGEAQTEMINAVKLLPDFFD